MMVNVAVIVFLVMVVRVLSIVAVSRMLVSVAMCMAAAAVRMCMLMLVSLFGRRGGLLVWQRVTTRGQHHTSFSVVTPLTLLATLAVRLHRRRGAIVVCMSIRSGGDWIVRPLTFLVRLACQRACCCCCTQQRTQHQRCAASSTQHGVLPLSQCKCAVRSESGVLVQVTITCTVVAGYTPAYDKLVPLLCTPYSTVFSNT